jgi:hypothetical protein
MPQLLHIQSECALATASHYCILGVHMNVCALLNNVMRRPHTLTQWQWHGHKNNGVGLFENRASKLKWISNMRPFA